MLLTAQKIHDGRTWLPGGSVIEADADGTIITIHGASMGDKAVFYDGVLTPGFVNAHCHLELSHMKDVVPEHTGLIPFLKHIPLHRNDHTDEQKKAARHAAYNDMLHNGIVAVGDIANVTDTADLRALGKMHFYTFIEALGFTESNADKAFSYASSACDVFAAQQQTGKILKQAIVPHAPYSVSKALFKLIDKYQPQAVLSIHNQESQAEDEYYLSKQGPVADLLKTFGIDDSSFTPSGSSSLQTYLQWLSPTHPFIFVHNTYTPVADVRFAASHLDKIFWCLCPNANLYIENRLPDVDMFIAEGANICVGTDSLASNHQLSILAELHTLKQNFPHLDWEMLISWGTYNGACALQMNDRVGSLTAGTKPGILQLTNLDTNPRVRVVSAI